MRGLLPARKCEGRLPRVCSCLQLWVLLCAATSAPAPAQSPLSSEDAALAKEVWGEASKGGRLACRIETRKPFPDYTFHFNPGYIVQCSWGQFQLVDTHVGIFTRITPEGGTPLELGSFYIFKGSRLKLSLLPGLPDRSAEFDVSGTFSIGEGRYEVQVIVADQNGRTHQRKWKVRLAHSRQTKLPVVLAPHTAAPVEIPKWDGPQAAGLHGPRLTVLLDAAPMVPLNSVLDTHGHFRLNFVPPVRAWDQAFLLQVLSSLLQQTHCSSVRLIAFCSEEQREIYRADTFQPSGFAQLQQALHDLELGTVSVQVLGRPHGGVEMLNGFVNKELTTKEPSDAVIFLRPGAYIGVKIPQRLLGPRKAQKPRFYFFQLILPDEGFSDSIVYLTEGREGTAFRFGSPAGLAQAIRKMQAQLQERDEGGS